MKKLILAGLLSVGAACANETENCANPDKMVEKFLNKLDE